MDSDCDSYSYGDYDDYNDEYYDDNDYYDDDYYDEDNYSIDSCYQYDDNSIISSPSDTSDSSSPRKSTSWDLDSDDDYVILSFYSLQDEHTLPNTLNTPSNRKCNVESKVHHKDKPSSQIAF